MKAAELFQEKFSELKHCPICGSPFEIMSLNLLSDEDQAKVCFNHELMKFIVYKETEHDRAFCMEFINENYSLYMNRQFDCGILKTPPNVLADIDFYEVVEALLYPDYSQFEIKEFSEEDLKNFLIFS